MSMATGTDSRGHEFPDDSGDELVARVCDEFLERVERGERPDIESCAAQYPEISAVLRNILPGLQALRGQGSRTRSGDPGARSRVPGSGSTEDEFDADGCLGDFRILSELGRGGMGIVYEAQQLSLKRRVALKVLPFAAALDPRRLERFRNEAQAAARLHHAHIVPVYSVGCERGVYYYAMQIIEGDSLARIIRNLRQTEHGRGDEAPGPMEDHSKPPPSGAGTRSDFPAGKSASDGSDRPVPSEARSDSESGSLHMASPGPDRRDSADTGPAEEPLSAEWFPDTRTYGALSTAPGASRSRSFVRAVVELGIHAAEALEHAHSFDIVHRDVKPANLMIDRRGHVWVTDFGLARMRDETGVTLSGDFVGTVLYSSPEQVLGRRGAVDSRTDIYSLGATLYELLTLKPVVRNVRRERILHEITQEEPVPPRRINRAIPADLETILLKALSRDPGQRYQTARELADDLRRFQDSRPVLARRPSVLERTARWMRRHRTIVAGAVAVLFLAVIGLAVSNILIAREQARTRAALQQVAEKHRITEQVLKSEARQRELAERERAAARQQQALAEHHFQQARELLEVFMQLSEEELQQRPELSDLRSRLLQVSLDYYQDFIEQSRDNPPLRAELADSHLRVARILHEIGSTPAAVESLEQALRTQEELVREHPRDRELRRRLFSMYFALDVFRGGSELLLVAHPRVQEHLEISDGQKEELSALEEQYHNSWRALRKQAGITEVRQEFQTQTARALNRLADVLDARQHKRLQQIALQRRGIEACTDPEIAREIGLKAGQLSEIQAIRRRSRETIREAFRNGRHHEAREAISERQQLIRNSLSPEQQSAFSRLTGDPFASRLHLWPRRRFRGTREKARHQQRRNRRSSASSSRSSRPEPPVEDLGATPDD